MTSVPSLDEIMGKTVQGVVYKEGDSEPKHQLFLVFEDDTHLELYTLDRDLNFIKKMRSGDVEWVKEYLADESEIVFEESTDS